MSELTQHTETNEPNILSLLKFKFLPYWPLLIFSTVVCFIGGYSYMKMALPTYEASATLLIKDEKKGSDDARMIEALNVFGSKKIVENEIEVIRSRALMREVVKNLGLYAPVSMEKEIKTISAYLCSPINIEVRDPEKIEEVEKVYFNYQADTRVVTIQNQNYPLGSWVKTPYGELRFTTNTKLKYPTNRQLFFSLIPVKKVVNNLIKNLNVNAVNKLSSVVNLQFVDQVPERGEDILNELISSYNRAGINDKNALADNTLKFIEERLNHVKFELDSVDKQIQMYRSGQGAINLSEQGTLFLKNVGENDQKSAVLTTQLAALSQVQSYINSGQSKGGIVPSTLGIEDPVLSQLLNRLSNAEIEYQKLKNTTAENNPVLISLTNEIKEIKPNILESIKVQKINLKARIDQIQRTNQQYSTVLQGIPEKERKLLEISRQKTIINNVYDFLLQKKEETAISYASTVPDSRVLDVAEASIKPISPKKSIVFAAAMALAFIFTFGFVFLKDFASSKILFRTELEKLTPAPVWGEIILTPKEVATNPVKFNPEQYFQIIANLGLLSKNNSYKKILFTSSISGEGKSYLCQNMARALAETGRKVVIVDLDFKKQTTSLALSKGTPKTVTDFLIGSCEAHETINTTDFPNVSIIKAGVDNSNYTALLSNNRIEQLFLHLGHTFDFILVDTSPIDPVTDALIISQLSDITVYVVKHGYTPKNIFQLRNEKVKSLSPTALGIIFNGVKPRGFLRGFGYGYGYDYAYMPGKVK